MLFTIKITLEDGTVIDDVSASIPDIVLTSMIGACEGLGHVDSTGSIIKGGRSITYAVRAFLTDKITEYSKKVASSQLEYSVQQQVDALKNSMAIIENLPPPVVEN